MIPSFPLTRRAAPLAAAVVIALVAGFGSCGCSERPAPPNVLWVVWDTVRADRMSLYGHERETTPFLDSWSEGALVFDDCISTACSTVPSHASLFTGKLPSEHGTRFGHRWLDEHHETVAELLGRAGYDTFLWAANPHISRNENFVQGFQEIQHPWDPDKRQRALQIVSRKLRGDQSTELPQNIKVGNVGPWAIKAAGELAEQGLVAWLGERDAGDEDRRPWFAFINYMEAHRPMIPPRRFRERMMSPEQVEASKHVDRSWTPMWAYTFGLHEYSAEELDVMARTYDATLAELDALLESLLGSLEAAGALEDTIVILTADHGEHLGEHHQMDHQFSLYDGLIRVPLVLHAPGRVAPGRSAAPVMNFDVFPTLLQLADVAPPADLDSTARSLLEPLEDRSRLAELPATFTEPFVDVGKAYPQFDPNDWKRKLRAYREGRHKLIWSSKGEHELYDVVADPEERHDLFHEQPDVARDLLERMESFSDLLQDPLPGDPQRGGHPPEYLELLKGLGYVSDGDDEDD